MYQIAVGLDWIFEVDQFNAVTKFYHRPTVTNPCCPGNENLGSLTQN